MISRHWKGIARPGQEDAYVHHLMTDTFPLLRRLPGFVRASILQRRVAAGTEFQIVTVWESIESIKAFAGDQVETAVVPEEVQRLMVSYEGEVAHYEIRDVVESRGIIDGKQGSGSS
jgi:heme-degrading monooxygenase HmoA